MNCSICKFGYVRGVRFLNYLENLNERKMYGIQKLLVMKENEEQDWRYERMWTSSLKRLTTYTECHRRNGPNFGRVFLMLNYTDITQNTYIQS